MTHRFSRRALLGSLAALPVLGSSAQREAVVTGAAASNVGGVRSAPVTAAMPFSPGDVVAGCTLLNDPKDDHRGRGRILHFDSGLKLKNTLWLDDTTHIVQGMRFGPDRSLWAFDTFAYRIVRVAPDGRRLPNFTAAPARSFANVCFAPDGRFFMGENYVGEKSRVALRTTLPFMPGTQRLGDGHLFEFSPQGKLLREHATRVHGGMGGFQALTSAALVPPDARRIVYTSESGPKVFQYDLVERRQLPDLVSHEDNKGKFFFDVAYDRSGRLLVVNGLGIDALDATGRVARSYPLGSFGWASMSEPLSSTHVYATNFFTGEIAKLDLSSGTVVARADVGIRKSLSGVAEFPG